MYRCCSASKTGTAGYSLLDLSVTVNCIGAAPLVKLEQLDIHWLAGFISNSELYRCCSASKTGTAGYSLLDLSVTVNCIGAAPLVKLEQLDIHCWIYQ